MSDDVRVYRSRDTHITFDNGGPLPAGATFEAEIRESAKPSSAKIADWVIDTTDATTSGKLYLSIPAGTITSEMVTGRMDIAQVGPSTARITLTGSLPVAIEDVPTVVGAG